MKSDNLLYFVFLFVAASLFVACDDDEGNTPSGPTGPTETLADARQDMAGHIADNFILPAYEQLATDFANLKTEADAFAANADEAGLNKVRAALKTAWLSWQDAAIYQMGPTSTNALRVALNTYPIDPELVESNVTSGTYTLGSLSNKGAEGFPAIDFLLNDGDVLPTLTGQDNNRMTYLTDLIDHMKEQIDLVNNEWKNGGFVTNFRAEVSNGTDVGSALGLIVNAIDLHFQRFLRDGKIAIPGGVRSAGVPRPTATEAFYGGYSVELLDRGLTAYFNLFKGEGINGTTENSLLAYLNRIEQEGISKDIESKFQQSLDKVAALSSPLSQQIEQDNDKVIEVFLSLQELVGLFKSDMASVMGVMITNQDTDGD
ncbi:MAG: imelysin family protein [Bacteroidota bacterium]